MGFSLRYGRRAFSVSIAGVVAVLVVSWPHGASGEEFAGLAKLMSAEEYSRSGLAKLSNSERAALDAWFRSYQTGELETARTKAVVAAVEDARSEIRTAQAAERIDARIAGTFIGWSGKTVFRLDNGQVWRQRLPGKYRHLGDPNPAVVISRNALGFYVLAVPETGRRTGVERVR